MRLLAGNFTQASAGDIGGRQDVWQVSQWFPTQPGILNKIDTALLALGRGEVCVCECVCVWGGGGGGGAGRACFGGFAESDWVEDREI